ncbi:VIT1/CCC1 transporter family protein [Candidatus Altiarchaeota archaeon]
MKINFLEIIRVIREEDIARRYFVMNSFDGTLTALGIILALYLAQISSSRIIIISCMGAAIAMGVSGFWGAYSAEYAERRQKFLELERHMMKDLDGTNVERSMMLKTIVISLVCGVSSILASVTIIIPFVFSHSKLLDIQQAYMISIMIVACILAGMGIFVGSIARENILVSALKMLSAGIIVTVLSIMLESVKVI